MRPGSPKCPSPCAGRPWRLLVCVPRASVAPGAPRPRTRVFPAPARRPRPGGEPRSRDGQRHPRSRAPLAAAVHRRGHPPGGVHRRGLPRRGRRAPVDGGLQPLPPQRQHDREPDLAGRLAAGTGPERRQPLPRPPGRRAPERPVRRLGPLEQRPRGLAGRGGDRAGRRRLGVGKRGAGGRHPALLRPARRRAPAMRTPGWGISARGARTSSRGSRRARASSSCRARHFSTDGVVLVAPENRGPVDIDAASRHDSALARWRGTLGAGGGRGVHAAHLRRVARQRDRLPAEPAPSPLRLGGALGAAPAPGRPGARRPTSRTSRPPRRSARSTPRGPRRRPQATSSRSPPTRSAWRARPPGRTPPAPRRRSGPTPATSAGETREDYLVRQGRLCGPAVRRRHARPSRGCSSSAASPSAPTSARSRAPRLDHWEDSDGHLRTSAIASGAPLSRQRLPDPRRDRVQPERGPHVAGAADGLEFHAAASAPSASRR